MGLQVAPSILGAAVCEAVAFLVGALTDIPALRQFCLVAATAVAVGFVLQVHGMYLRTAIVRAVSVAGVVVDVVLALSYRRNLVGGYRTCFNHSGVKEHSSVVK